MRPVVRALALAATIVGLLPASSSGAPFPATDRPATRAPGWIGESNQEAAHFGVSVAGAGDVNGDGYGDLIVGAHYYDNGQADEGRAFAYYGSPAGLSTTPNWTAESDQVAAFFGVSVAGAGDVNADGYDDVIVGAPTYDNGQRDEGRAFVYF